MRGSPFSSRSTCRRSTLGSPKGSTFPWASSPPGRLLVELPYTAALDSVIPVNVGERGPQLGPTYWFEAVNVLGINKLD
jgi:hypothetical protein